MPYQYEIFLSYSRVGMVESWLDKFFEPLFGQYLREELLALQHEDQYDLPDGRLRVFRDQREIGAGERWPDALRNAARDSRCAVAILTPSYFESGFCRAEMETFRRRGRELKRDLLVPVRFHDCLKMPLAEQVFDLSQYTAMVHDSERWVEFHDQIKVLAAQVAMRVVKAPPYPDDPERDPWLAAGIPAPPGATPIHPGRICL